MACFLHLQSVPRKIVLQLKRPFQARMTIPFRKAFHCLLNVVTNYVKTWNVFQHWHEVRNFGGVHCVLVITGFVFTSIQQTPHSFPNKGVIWDVFCCIVQSMNYIYPAIVWHHVCLMLVCACKQLFMTYISRSITLSNMNLFLETENSKNRALKILIQDGSFCQGQTLRLILSLGHLILFNQRDLIKTSWR